MREVAASPPHPRPAYENRETAEHAASRRNHSHVSLRQYPAAPSGSMPSDIRSANRRHKGFRPGRSESPKSMAKTAESIVKDKYRAFLIKIFTNNLLKI
jgi:hypothetical protein